MPKNFPDLITRLREQQFRQTADAEEKELRQHIASRAALRRNMDEDDRFNAAAESEHDAARAALQAFGQKYSWSQRNSDRDIVAEGARLSAAANRPVVLRKYEAGHSPRELLIRGCRDLSLQERLQEAGEAWKALWQRKVELESKAGVASDRAAQGRRERVELLGRIRSQFGPEGERWRRVEQDDQVSIVAVVGADGKPLVHPENLTHLNNQMLRANREIREAASALAAANCDRLVREMAEAGRVVESLEQQAVESEV